MFGTLEPDVYFYGDGDREDRPRQVPHHQRRLHHLRAADAALGDRQRQRHGEPGRLRDAAQRGDPGEGRPGVLPADDVLPDPGGRSRHRLPAAAVRIVARDGIVDQQRLLLGDQPQPGRHVLPRLDVLARQRRSAPSTATCSGPQAQGNLRYYGLDEKEAIVNGAPRNRAAEQDDPGAASARTCRSASRRAPGSTTSPTSRCSRPTATTSRRPRTATAPLTAACPGRGATCR